MIPVRRILSRIRTINPRYGLLDQPMSYSSQEWKEKNERSGRPISPHVTIYKFPVAAISSIANRGTGIMLSVGISGVATLSAVGVDVPSTMQVIGSVTAIGTLAKFSVVFPLTYHYLASIRHFLWDRYPDLLENEKVEQSSYILFGSSLAISTIFSFLQI